MNDLGLNKVLAAVLATALGVMAVRELPHLLLHSDYPETPSYSVGPLETESTAGPVDVPFPSPDFVAAMDVERGEKVFKKCTSCHNADNGGTHSTGPNLWGVVGNTSGAKTDFKYSSAMTAANLTWDYETLNDYLAKPTKFLKGTNMNFIGLKKEADRAAVMAYLRQQADTQIALPVAITVEAPSETGDMVEDMSVTGTETSEDVINQIGEIVEEQAGEAMQKTDDVMDKAEGLLDQAKDVVEEVTEEVVENVEDAPQ